VKTRVMNHRGRTSAIWALSGVLLAVSSLWGWLPAGAQSTFSFVKIGLLATGEGEQYRQILESTVQYLREQLPNVRCEIVPLDPREVTREVEKGALDFVFVDPALYVPLEDRFAVKRLATAQVYSGGKPVPVFGGTLFCRADNAAVKGPESVAGRTLMSVQGDPLGAWLSVLREFKKWRVNPERACKELLFVPSEQAVVSAVIKGEADVGAVRAGTLERMAAEGALDIKQVRVIPFPGAYTRNVSAGYPFQVSTRLYPEWVFASGPRAPEMVARQVAAALLTMPHVAAGRPVPDSSAWSIPDSYVSVHDLLQDLRRPPYQDYGRIHFVDVLRQYMYWFIIAAVFVILLMLTLSYVTRLNRELVGEIEGRKKAEVSLRESVERFQHIVSCSGDWIWETDEQGRYTYSSAIVKNMLGYEVADVLGKQLYDLCAASERQRIGERANVLSARMDRLFREKYRMLTKEGRVVIHELTAAPIVNAKGKLIGYRGVSRDVTSQVRFVTL